MNPPANTSAGQAFQALNRLYGPGAAERLAHAHCMVVGLGGVGSWTVEALARSGVGTLTLVDLDDVCTSNRNRQLHTLDETVGRPKVEVMADRVREIHPDARVNAVHAFLSERNVDELMDAQPDVLIDAVDGRKSKCLILDHARQRGIQVVTVGGAGGRTDPTRIVVADITQSGRDPLLKVVRKQLRQKHGFPRDPDIPWGVPCVFSTESIRYINEEGCIQLEKPEVMDGTRLDCFKGLGSVSYLTGAFGLTAAGVAVDLLLKEPDS